MMKKIKNSSSFPLIFTYGIFVFACLFARHSSAAEQLPLTVAKIKPGIVAVGTYMPKRNPRAVFLATGFAVGDGSLIVTNAHVIRISWMMSILNR